MDSWSGMYFWGLGFSSETAGGETKIGVGVFTEVTYLQVISILLL